ncbi:MAG: chromosomal replication initiator protein DnaA [Candidatus Aerophobetes bacterium]|nr:chromosomal replication initiator protein DnaA [Candidatus Aerophobetes bacterium]
MNSKEDIWQKLLFNIKKKVDSQNFKAWLEPLQMHSLINNKIIIGTPNSFFKEMVEKKYLKLIKKEMREIVDEDVEVDFITSSPTRDKKRVNSVYSSPKKRLFNRLNPRYTFSNFVVGNNNRLAHAAALAVAQSPAQVYNPLFIYGDVGLGKTHLLQAIAHYIVEKKKFLKFSYISSEQFTNEMINAIKDDKTVEFRKKYRYTDILLVDDIHFLAGKERTQEEFFHTFNALYEVHKQIVLSSDRSPTEIPTLKERLQSRFEWGLIADIQPPDLETRVAILKKRAEAEKMDLSDEVAIFIAGRVKTNIRKLEGCLIRLIARATLFKEKLDNDSAREILKDILPEKEHTSITIGLIQKVVSEYYSIKEENIKSKNRMKTIAFPRQIAMYLCRELTDASFPEIGEKFGGKDHTTVMYAWRKIDGLKDKNKNLLSDLEKLSKMLKNH